MCGRYALFAMLDDLTADFGLESVEYEPTYNAAPGQDLPVILGDASGRLTSARWGLVPSWSDGPRSDPDPINARAETLTESRYFRDAYCERRCLVPANGFYEWVETDDGKTPYFVSRADDRPFLMAGLWETWTPEQVQSGLGDFGVDSEPDSDPDAVRSFTVVTTEPNDFLADYHDRMAVLLDPESGERWLSDDDPSALLEPSDADLQAWPVSEAVNDPSNDYRGLVEAVA